MRSTSSWSWKSPLDRRLRSRMATRSFQFTGMEERNTRKSEPLRHKNVSNKSYSEPQSHDLTACIRSKF